MKAGTAGLYDHHVNKLVLIVGEGPYKAYRAIIKNVDRKGNALVELQILSAVKVQVHIKRLVAMLVPYHHLQDRSFFFFDLYEQFGRYQVHLHYWQSLGRAQFYSYLRSRMALAPTSEPYAIFDSGNCPRV